MCFTDVINIIEYFQVYTAEQWQELSYDSQQNDNEILFLTFAQISYKEILGKFF
jgi:hypothetical protein